MTNSNVATVAIVAKSVTITVNKLDPAAIREALSSAASVHPLACATALTADKQGGLSAAVEVGDDVSSAADRATDSLLASGYQVFVAHV